MFSISEAVSRVIYTIDENESRDGAGNFLRRPLPAVGGNPSDRIGKFRISKDNDLPSRRLTRLVIPSVR